MDTPNYNEPILVLDRDDVPCAVVIFDPTNPFTSTGWMIYPFSLVYGWIPEKQATWETIKTFKSQRNWCEVNAHPFTAIGGPLPGLFENIYCIHCVKGDDDES